MDRCIRFSGEHSYIECELRTPTIISPQCAPYGVDIGIYRKTLWTVKKVCIFCDKTIVVNQDGIEVLIKEKEID